MFADEEGEDFAEEFLSFFDLARGEFAEVFAGEALEVGVDEVVEDVFFRRGGRGGAQGPGERGVADEAGDGDAEGAGDADGGTGAGDAPAGFVHGDGGGRDAGGLCKGFLGEAGGFPEGFEVFGEGAHFLYLFLRFMHTLLAVIIRGGGWIRVIGVGGFFSQGGKALAEAAEGAGAQARDGLLGEAEAAGGFALGKALRFGEEDAALAGGEGAEGGGKVGAEGRCMEGGGGGRVGAVGGAGQGGGAFAGAAAGEAAVPGGEGAVDAEAGVGGKGAARGVVGADGLEEGEGGGLEGVFAAGAEVGLAGGRAEEGEEAGEEGHGGEMLHGGSFRGKKMGLGSGGEGEFVVAEGVRARVGRGLCAVAGSRRGVRGRGRAGASNGNNADTACGARWILGRLVHIEGPRFFPFPYS